uniref:Adenylate cyclase-associated CAP C-terminal domain-containing protein n=1 Tax=Hemiselmis tepida TaxID=464990 RepID=A0A7S0Z021_9CRYP|mmetsp:Transcript_25856/g.65803  ORF Transcript_25856/g.65803 Transcript_25856/m.65803 type:complete len:341 (+) Transcript_25856:109-1131(+)
MDSANKPLSKAQAIKQGKEKALSTMETTSNAKQHLVADRDGETIVLSQDSMPELPVVHLKGCRQCDVDIPSGTKVVKVLVEGCLKVNLRLSRCTIATSTLEIWRSDGCSVAVDCDVGTLQADLCKSLSLEYARKAQLGSLVQAGMQDLKVSFLDAPEEGFTTGLEQLRAQHPDQTINDDTDQFITRVLDGKVTTERILRLSNDYPTTQREKDNFDEEARRKAEAIEAMAERMLGVGSDADRVKEESAKQREAQEKDADVGPEARAAYRKGLGNEAFKKGDFTQAAVHYTEAILAWDKEPALFSNRAQCFLKMGQAGKALEDADRRVPVIGSGPRDRIGSP